MNHIVLFRPDIPQNTGNIGRTCAATNTKLHLIKPLGFEISDKHLKRAGMDYWYDLDITMHESFDDFFENEKGNYYFISKFGEQFYHEQDYNVTDRDVYFIFGRETKGLPDEIKDKYRDRLMRIPMGKDFRSLNVSNTVALILYEALRQQGFRDLS